MNFLLGVWIRLSCRPSRHDVVLCESSMLAAACPPGAPLSFWTDAEFASYAQSYWSDTWERIANFSAALRLEQRALTRSSITFYASRWAIREAMAQYEAKSESLVFAPFFAGLEQEPDRATAMAQVAKRNPARPIFVFLGVDWRRKGGDHAIGLLQALFARGINARLKIVGASPFPADAVPDGVEQLGFWTKDGGDEPRWRNLLSSAHFLLLPSRAEAMGISVLEGAAYATPTIGTPIGGIPSVIDHDRTGLLDTFENTDALAAKVAGLLADEAAYRALCQRCHDRYLEEFSAPVRSRQILDALARLTNTGVS